MKKKTEKQTRTANNDKNIVEFDVEKIKELLGKNDQEALLSLFLSLITHIKNQNEIIERLRNQIAKNSGNSGKPPSTDGYAKKPANLRRFQKEQGKKNGGQEGHKGDTLKQVANPDETEKVEVSKCEHCHESLEKVTPSHLEKRQVFDIPPLKIRVKEYQIETKTCPNCGKETKGKSSEAKDPVQYGSGIKTLASYFNHYHFIPLARTSEIFMDLFNLPLSEATTINADLELAEKIEPTNQEIKQQLIDASTVHFDETGMRVEGSLHWAHVASTPNLTHYDIHTKRGQEAINAIGILPSLKGTAIHDHWKPYFHYDCKHGLCNVHHIRELIFVLERYEQAWAEKMIDCLLEIKEAVESAKEAGLEQLSPEMITKFEQQYEIIIQEGLCCNPPPLPPPKKKRGRLKKTIPRNLVERLDTFRSEVLKFMYDFAVSFDNNLPERDIRMIKVKQKVSGSFRTFEGAKAFCKIRSYISTVRKNSYNVIEAIRNAFEGNPWGCAWA